MVNANKILREKLSQTSFGRVLSNQKLKFGDTEYTLNGIQDDERYIESFSKAYSAMKSNSGSINSHLVGQNTENLLLGYNALSAARQIGNKVGNITDIGSNIGSKVGRTVASPIMTMVNSRVKEFNVNNYVNDSSITSDGSVLYKVGNLNKTSELGTILSTSDPDRPEFVDYDGVLITPSQYYNYLTMPISKGGYQYTGATNLDGQTKVNSIIKSPNFGGVLRDQTPVEQQNSVKLIQDAEKAGALLSVKDPNSALGDTCERITLGTPENSQIDLDISKLNPDQIKQLKEIAKTDNGKKFITSNKGLLKEYGTNNSNSSNQQSGNDAQNTASDNNATASSTSGNGKETPQPSKNDKKTNEQKVTEKKKKDDKLTIGAQTDIPYFKVDGYNTLKFPNVWDNGPYHIPIMGLPPMRIQKDITKPIPYISVNAFGGLPDPKEKQFIDDMFIYDEDEQIRNSFLKLTIHPVDAEFLQNGAITETGKKHSANDKYKAKKDKGVSDRNNPYAYQQNNRSVILWDVDYKFAIEAKNDYTINHSNTYKPNFMEDTLGGFNSISNIASSIHGISQTSGGVSNVFNPIGSMGLSMASVGEQKIKEIIESLNVGSEGLNLGNQKDDFMNFVRDSLNYASANLTGARVDMADVWTESSTNVRYNFEINLRTMCPDPLDIQYCKDILLPLYILYTLSLPTDVAKIGYKTPPYIYCNVDKFLKIKLGGIENIQVTIPANEVNFRRAPRHVRVNLTIRDLYSVMKQKAYDQNGEIESDNGDTTEKDEFVNNFVEYALDMKKDNRTVVNEPYYLTEFCKIPAYMNALNQYIANKQAELDKAKEDAGENTDANKNKPKQENTTTKADTDKASGNKSDADKEIKAEKGKNGKTNIITSINGVVTGVVKGVKNIVAGVNKAIQPVRGLINTGKMILNTASNLKSAFKLVGSTANLQGILNGQFASSIGFTFNNLANATDIVTGLCDGVFSGGSAKEILKNLGELPQRIATNNMARLIDGNSMDLSSNFRDMGIMMYGVANGLGSTYASMSNLKYMGQQDTLGKLKTIFGGLSSIANGSDYITKQMAWQNNAGVIRGLLTSGQVTNAKTQERLQEVAQSSTEKLQESLSSKYVLGVDKNTGHYGLIPKDSVSDKSFNPNNTFKFDYDKGTWK